MQRFLPLMQREWLQHRFGWTLLALLPLALALLLTGFGQVQIDGDDMEHAGAALPTLLAMAAIAGCTAVVALIAWFSSLIIVSALARRDHADRSIEFWLSLPVSHSQSVAAPLLVHLILVPAAALVIGLLGGYALSFLLVGRVVGWQVWFGLPWVDIVAGTGAFMLRLMAGLPLATLWLSPLILLVVLMTAWFRRWGWALLAVGFGLGGYILKRLFGQPWLNEVTTDLLRHAARAFLSARDSGVQVSGPEQALDALHAMPAWLLTDLGYALRELASPLMLGSLLFSALCFALLIQ